MGEQRVTRWTGHRGDDTSATNDTIRLHRKSRVTHFDVGAEEKGRKEEMQTWVFVIAFGCLLPLHPGNLSNAVAGVRQ